MQNMANSSSLMSIDLTLEKNKILQETIICCAMIGNMIDRETLC